MAKEEKTSQIAWRMFIARWGFKKPPEAYREQWQRDRETVKWLEGLER